jgi:hypothetical protein
MRLAQVTAGVLVAVAALTGCSAKEPANDTLPTPSATAAEATPTWGPSDAPLPEKAQDRTADGFEQFARYYVSLINRLDTDLDSSYLRQFSRNCTTCERLASDADNDASKGYRYQGGTITIVATGPPAVTDVGAEIAFTVNQASYAVVDSAGKPVPGLSGSAVSGLPAGLAGTWSRDHWLVTNLSFG